ncbi:MAG: DUF4256 domain-containing protein [Anaerolineae bacterium]|jgi:hypothetical protein|nr:DUF4256 domain-containing protein [Anaerolineae bacterium]
MSKGQLSSEERADLLAVLQARFEKHERRHRGLVWAEVAARLDARPEKLRALREMERTGGEPDVVGRDAETGEFLFYDCAEESPSGRRNTCYDRAAREGRKTAAPAVSAVEMADALGVELLSEAEYRALQELGEFDRKTSSWVKTPAPIRKRGGALFCDRRYDHVFTYHNGADSYYAARGFRGVLRV